MGEGQEEEGNTPRLTSLDGDPRSQKSSWEWNYQPLGEDPWRGRQPGGSGSPTASSTTRGLRFLTWEQSCWVESGLASESSVPSLCVIHISDLSPGPPLTWTPA